jgi:hypothetical protein
MFGFRFVDVPTDLMAIRVIDRTGNERDLDRPSAESALQRRYHFHTDAIIRPIRQASIRRTINACSRGLTWGSLPSATVKADWMPVAHATQNIFNALSGL